MTISTDSQDPAQRPRLGERSLPLLRAHAQDRAGMARHAHGERPDAARSSRSEENWTLFDFESVFAAFREDTVFASEMYNQTIGLVFGPTILGMHGKAASRPSQPGGKAFRQSALDTVGTRGDRPHLRSARRRVQERRRRRSGQGGDVRVPDPGHRRAAGPAPGRSGDVPAAVAATSSRSPRTSRRA